MTGGDSDEVSVTSGRPTEWRHLTHGSGRDTSPTKLYFMKNTLTKSNILIIKRRVPDTGVNSFFRWSTHHYKPSGLYPTPINAVFFISCEMIELKPDVKWKENNIVLLMSYKSFLSSMDGRFSFSVENFCKRRFEKRSILLSLNTTWKKEL